MDGRVIRKLRVKGHGQLAAKAYGGDLFTLRPLYGGQNFRFRRSSQDERARIKVMGTGPIPLKSPSVRKLPSCLP